MAAAVSLSPVENHTQPPGAPGAVHDPVCGMSVEPATTGHRAEHGGRSYFFCSAGCRERFTAEPARYLIPAAAAARPAAGEGLWTCPMHPQIVRAGPGSCPICALGGLGFIYSGVYEVAATSPDWVVTRWVLETARTRSIKAHAAGTEAPPGLDDELKILIGVAHFAAHCAVCHGAPGVPEGDIATGLNPHPPDLATPLTVTIAAMKAVPANKREAAMNIGEAASTSGVPAKTIRYYEAAGLIATANRSAGGYRVYTQADVVMLRFIKRARDLGFSIERIRRLVDLWQDKSRASTDVKRLALDHIAEIRTKIAAMSAMGDAVQELADACDGDDRPDCPILRDLECAAVGTPPSSATDRSVLK